MNLRTTFAFVGKDLREGPRGMMFVWVLIFPILITFVVRLVFGGLLTPLPRLGIVNEDGSVLAERALERESLAAMIVESDESLRSLLASHDLDAGLVLRSGFDERLRAGERPVLELLFSGQTAANDQLVVSVEIIDIVREVAGQSAALTVEQQVLGGPSVPLDQRLVPLLVLVAVAFAGLFLPAASILQEKENRTLSAVLVTRVQVGDVMLAKGIVAFALSFGVGALTLLLNGGMTAAVASLLLVIGIASVMCVALGIIVGAAVNDMATMFSIWKGGGLVLFAPAILFLFPDVPGWIAWLFPTYYFLGPLNEIMSEGAALSDVWMELTIAGGIAALLIVMAVPASRRMELKLAAA